MNKTNTRHIKVGLIGNPNSGKSTLFNVLTGLRQKISNYPGVTVEQKTGFTTLSNGQDAEVIDFPGLYSLYPNSTEEKLVVKILADEQHDMYPDIVVYIADVNNLERHMLLASQIIDLKIPMIFVLNFIDALENEAKTVDVDNLSKYLQIPVVALSSRNNINIEGLINIIGDYSRKGTKGFTREKPLFNIPEKTQKYLGSIKEHKEITNDHLALLYGHHYQMFTHLSPLDKEIIENEARVNQFESLPNQVQETMDRYNHFTHIARKTVKRASKTTYSLTDKIDNVVTNPIIGPIIFFSVMLLMFQSMYLLAAYPMDWIEYLFGTIGNGVRSILPQAWYTDLLVDGVIAGLGGVLVFIPQIAILFLLISLLEESGYMSRAVYMFDGLMQKFGLSGRSLVSLISSGACAIPAIMSARTIGNWKERLITILVSPLISCSARIPVYTVLIGFVVPSDSYFYIFNKQGLAFMGLYLLGIVGALAASLFFKVLIKSEGDSFLMIELPQYKPPIWKNAFINVKTKVGEFIIGAGKVIISISIVLWFLASYGPAHKMEEAIITGQQEGLELGMTESEVEDYIAGKKIEVSYAGHLGKFIEPAIKPLGFDWKIGIALLTSFAAREVFVGTMATIYSIGSADDEMSVRDKMATQLNPATGLKVYNPATALSLLIFYVFAMQCMSTLAVTKSETGSWKWPTVQFLFMGAMAYLGSFIAYQLCS